VGRVFARHITRLFGDRIEIANEPRANGLLAAQRTVAAKPDGNTLAFLSTGLIYTSLLGEEGIPESFAQVGWLGSFNIDRRVLLVTKASGVNRFEDLIGRPKPLILVAGATSQSGYYEARILDYLTDANLKIVPGFRGSSRNLALISGEGEGIVGAMDGLEAALDQPGSKIVLRMNDIPMTGLPADKGAGAPALAAFAKGPDAKPLLDLLNAQAQLGRIVGLPPGASPEVLADWRRKFDVVTADPGFRAECAMGGHIIEPTPGAAVNAAVTDLLSTRSDEVRASLRRALACKGAAICV